MAKMTMDGGQWTPDAAMAAYNVAQWSEGYVTIDSKGMVRVRPHAHRGGSSAAIDPDDGLVLSELTRACIDAGLSLPILLRFSDILHDRVNALCGAFNSARERLNYQGGYTAVYPIKVNQQRHVVEQIIRAEPARSRQQIGLEAGSKPELMTVLSLSRPGDTIVCNGYKDRAFIRLALLGQTLGMRVFIVIEMLDELKLVLEESEKLGIRPLLGVRARLSSIGKGNWQNTGGEKSKFGLSAGQILSVVEQLREAGSLDTLTLLHFHLGSQIANIRDIQTGMRECARFYVELMQLGAAIATVDVGGGLGIDYEGTRSRSAYSINYSMEEYAFQVLRTLQEEARRNDLPEPDVITESGRSLTAHHAILVTNIIDEERSEVDEQQATAMQETGGDLAPDLPAPLSELQQDYLAVLDRNRNRTAAELYHDASQALQEAQSQFIHGTMSLAQRAAAEKLYKQICLRLQQTLDRSKRTHRDIIDEINDKLADKLFVNFSLFQSLPDVWGIDQIFPILPLAGLDKPPLRRAVVQDITCDSDGRIDSYVDSGGIETTLPVPDFQREDLKAANGSHGPLLGFFLTGAYQEILGDLHNLFGDTDSVDVRISEDGRFRLDHLQHGDTVKRVLSYVNYDWNDLLAACTEKVRQAELTDELRGILLAELEAGLQAYTYFSK
ncbi:biosynthetic arginine decarboxylase [Allohahella marinimesophila]